MLTVIIAITLIHIHIENVAGPFIYDDIRNLPSKKTALILGARVYPSGRLSGMLKDRVLTGIDLYKRKKVEKLLLSGDGRTVRYNETVNMKKYLLKKGIPETDILVDPSGLDTRASMRRAGYIFKLKDFVIVTQRFHLARAVFYARACGLDAVGIVADRREYRQSSVFRSSMRETGARIKAFFYVRIGSPARKKLFKFPFN